jgi:hypothetical protein
MRFHSDDLLHPCLHVYNILSDTLDFPSRHPYLCFGFSSNTTLDPEIIPAGLLDYVSGKFIDWHSID